MRDVPRIYVRERSRRSNRTDAIRESSGSPQSTERKKEKKRKIACMPASLSLSPLSLFLFLFLFATTTYIVIESIVDTEGRVRVRVSRIGSDAYRISALVSRSFPSARSPQTKPGIDVLFSPAAFNSACTIHGRRRVQQPVVHPPCVASRRIRNEKEREREREKGKSRALAPVACRFAICSQRPAIAPTLLRDPSHPRALLPLPFSKRSRNSIAWLHRR